MITLPVLSNPAPELLVKLPQTHLLRDLMVEHELLLRKLDVLDLLADDFLGAATTIRGPEIAGRMRALAFDFLHAEPHHQREEQVLFPELERRGIVMPPRIMRQEHEELRALKSGLLEALGGPTPDAEIVAREAHALSEMLRLHIRKENDVLFPMAWSAIPERSMWSAMRVAALAFGPCCTECGCRSAPAR